MSSEPLAERMRPQHIDDVLGQEHLLGDAKILRKVISSKQPVSLLLWGPPGSGKTTLARIIARETGSECIELSAVTSGKADITRVIEHAKQNRRLGQNTVLFIDEIHRFNKAQQDAFLPHVEDGTITLIGATTENPSFEIISPLLSRSRVLVLEPHSKDTILQILQRALKKEGVLKKRVPPKSLNMIAEYSQGDGRVALGNLELALQLSNGGVVSLDIVEQAAQSKLPSYDKDGEQHYNLISAFIKSMRGGDGRATLYYLARMLQAGEDPKFIARRMIIFASEDVGIAASAALNLAVSTFDAVERIGMPECQYNLFHCAYVLAKTDKSRKVSDNMYEAFDLARKFPDAQVPLHLRNAPSKLMKDLGYQQGTKWEAGFQHPEGFMPKEITY